MQPLRMLDAKYRLRKGILDASLLHWLNQTMHNSQAHILAHIAIPAATLPAEKLSHALTHLPFNK